MFLEQKILMVELIKNPKFFPTILIFLMTASSIVCGYSGDFRKTIYWAAAAILNIAVTYQEKKMNLPYDISRCSNENCEIKETCERYMQIERDKKDKNAIWDAYAIFELNNNKCENKIEE